MANQIVYEEDWSAMVQMMLDEANKFEKICRVDYTDGRVLHHPYITDATVQNGTRGSAYTHQDFTLTDESVTISTFKILPMYIDRADLAQSQYATQMKMAERQGVLLKEAIETAVYADHANWTNFGTASIGDGGAATDPITVSINNIDDIIRGVKREIREANGEALMQRNGAFIVWRPADFEILEQFAQSNGYIVADATLKAGTAQGFEYMGVTHYTSNLLASGHLMAGVKGLHHVGICRSTYGQIVIDSEPATSSGAVSAIAVVSRADFAVKTWANYAPVLFDINVA